jgi:hypothetical protein
VREVDLCAVVIGWLAADGWDVHQEVDTSGGTADIVASKGNRLWIVEAKLGFGFDVMAQAEARRRAAHWVSVAVPDARHSDAFNYGRFIAQERGIGVLRVTDERVIEDVRPACGLSKQRAPDWWPDYRTSTQRADARERALGIARAKGFLCEETRTFGTAGSPSPTRWTYWKAMEKEMRRLLRTAPMATKPLWTALPSHARTRTPQGLHTYLSRGAFPGIVSIGGRPMQWALEERAR